MDTSSITPLKICTKCKRELPATLEYFYADKRVKGGLLSRCKECVRAANRDGTGSLRIIVGLREGYQFCPGCKQAYPATHDYFWYDHNRKSGLRVRCIECCKKREQTPKMRAYQAEYQRNWRKLPKGAEYVREHNRRRLSDPEYVDDRRKYGIKYRKSEHGKTVVRVNSQRRRARVKNAQGKYSAADVELQIRSQTDKRGKLRCWWCGKMIRREYHIDHVMPLDKGGSNGAENIVIAHPKCNLEKGTKTPAEYKGRLL